MAKRRPAFWLLKTEPSEFSIDDLARVEREPWSGVRNYRARNYMREMAPGDLVLFYHSSTDPTGVVGVARVACEAYPDPTQFDSKSKYFDPASRREAPRWHLVDVEFVEKLPRVVTLAEMKSEPNLGDMLVVRRGMRLSVQPVAREDFSRVLGMAGATTVV